ncbi:MAG: TIGR04013 family B12-binding domain/radical SAM domain-containing protein [Desulfurococcaceae archaeon]
MDINVILYYNDKTKYSINPLIASLDNIPGVKIILVDSINTMVSVVNKLRERGKCIVGFSLMTTMLTDDGFLRDLISLNNILSEKNCITIAGGPHASGDPIGTLVSLKFKYVFIGEAEKSIKDFVHAILNNDDIYKVKGLMFIDGKELVFTGRQEIIDLNEYDPFPYWRGIFSPIEITRGCPYGCFYCQVSYMHGKFYRHRDVERVVFYVDKAVKHGKLDIRFISPNGLAYGSKSPFEKPRHELLENLLCRVRETLGTRGRIFYGTFPSEFRPEYVDEEFMKILAKYVHNRSIIIGAQSGSEKVLKFIHRSHGIEEVLNAVDIAITHGFTPEVDIIVGFPGEDLDDLEMTLELCRKVISKNGVIHLHYYIPLPGTPFGLRPPTRIPTQVRRELSKIVGRGKGYGSWLKQEHISWKIVELHREGIIMPMKRS